MRHWIRDRERRTRALPLHKLLRQVAQVAGDARPQWLVHKVHGQGAIAERWERDLAGRAEAPIPFDRLEELTRPADGLSELDAECLAGDLRVRFGVHEGAALYVDAPPGAAGRIVAPFKDIQAYFDG